MNKDWIEKNLPIKYDEIPVFWLKKLCTFDLNAFIYYFFSFWIYITKKTDEFPLMIEIDDNEFNNFKNEFFNRLNTETLYNIIFNGTEFDWNSLNAIKPNDIFSNDIDTVCTYYGKYSNIMKVLYNQFVDKTIIDAFTRNLIYFIKNNYTVNIKKYSQFVLKDMSIEDLDFIKDVLEKFNTDIVLKLDSDKIEQSTLEFKERNTVGMTFDSEEEAYGYSTSLGKNADFVKEIIYLGFDNNLEKEKLQQITLEYLNKGLSGIQEVEEEHKDLKNKLLSFGYIGFKQLQKSNSKRAILDYYKGIFNAINDLIDLNYYVVYNDYLKKNTKNLFRNNEKASGVISYFNNINQYIWFNLTKTNYRLFWIEDFYSKRHVETINALFRKNYLKYFQDYIQYDFDNSNNSLMPNSAYAFFDLKIFIEDKRLPEEIRWEKFNFWMNNYEHESPVQYQEYISDAMTVPFNVFDINKSDKNYKTYDLIDKIKGTELTDNFYELEYKTKQEIDNQYNQAKKIKIALSSTNDIEIEQITKTGFYVKDLLDVKNLEKENWTEFETYIQENYVYCDLLFLRLTIKPTGPLERYNFAITVNGQNILYFIKSFPDDFEKMKIDWNFNKLPRTN